MIAGLRRSLVLLTALALPALAVLIALGTWQLERLAWKQKLIADIEAKRSAAPITLAEALERQRQGNNVEFLPVEVEARPVRNTTLKLYWVEDGTPGWRLFVPYETDDGTQIVVDRGFVTDAVLETLNPASGPEMLRGRLRLPETQGPFRPDNVAASNVWYWRDLAGMAASLNLDETRLAPVFLALDSTNSDMMWPRARALPPELPNRHLGYALTWFGLAICLVGVYAAYVVKTLRSRS